jgi:hypothetical protein
VNCINRNDENAVTTILNLIHFFDIQNCKIWVQKQTLYVIFVKRCLNYPQNAILLICHLTYQNGMNHFIKKSFLPKEQKSCCFHSYLHNHLSDWHEICCTMSLIRFYILHKNDATTKHKLHSKLQDRMLKFTSKMNLVL